MYVLVLVMMVVVKNVLKVDPNPRYNILAPEPHWARNSWSMYFIFMDGEAIEFDHDGFGQE